MQKKLIGPIRRFIHVQSDYHTIYRQSESGTMDVSSSEDISGTSDISESTYGTSSPYVDVGTRVLAFAGVQESMQPTEAGQIQSQRLIAYSLPDEDIQEDDRLDHGGTRMEIVASFGLPNEHEPAVIRHELEDA